VNRSKQLISWTVFTPTGSHPPELSREILKELVNRDLAPSAFVGDLLAEVLWLSVLTKEPHEAAWLLETVEGVLH
jgi:hypothetical protein